MNCTLRINKAIRRRKSGALRSDIENLKSCLNLIKGIATSSKRNFYLSWYQEYIENRLILSKINQYLPGRMIPNKIKLANTTAINKILRNDVIILNDILLPYPKDNSEYGEYMEYLNVISDSVLAYLINDIDPNRLYEMYSQLPFWNEGLYEYKEIRLETGDIVIDAGASFGVFSALAGIKGCKAYAFEPATNNIEKYLSKTAELNPNITICQYALSDKEGELDFEEDVCGLLGSSSVMPLEKSNKTKAQAIDLDTFVNKNNLPRVDFIKADIEGAERDMLMGAKRVMKEFSPKIAICTYHLPDDPQVLRELIMSANPNYIIEERWKKMYAHVPK
ncbi:MAG: FkbM family methyltransferase [Treponema sp.]|nr:FkbM family methyltransferase [Treponema sp.]